jgi:hypothetical protein
MATQAANIFKNHPDYKPGKIEIERFDGTLEQVDAFIHKCGFIAVHEVLELDGDPGEYMSVTHIPTGRGFNRFLLNATVAEKLVRELTTGDIFPLGITEQNASEMSKTPQAQIIKKICDRYSEIWY